MKVRDLCSDPLIIEWIDTLNPSENTRKLYLQAMQNFTDWAGKTPDELLTEAEEEVKAGKLMRQRKIKTYLIGFRKYLQDQGLSSLTVRSRLTGVKSFYKLFDIEIPSLPRSGNKARPLEENKYIPSKEDIQEVLKVCDPFEKALILVGVSSGLSANEIRNLKIKDFKAGYDPETEITTLDLRRGKVGFDFVTFLSPEASRAVWDYLSFRERKPKIPTPRRVQQLSKQKINDDGYLFIARNVPSTFLENQYEETRKLNENTIIKIYRSISEKAQKNTKTKAWNVIRSHNMRKFFNSTLLNMGADSFFVDFCMGHTLDDTRAAYFRASPEKLREIYLKYVPYLTIQKEADISESPEYLRIKQENQILQAETARHVVERSELQDLREKDTKREQEYQVLQAEMKKMRETFDSMEAIRNEYMKFFELKRKQEL